MKDAMPSISSLRPVLRSGMPAPNSRRIERAREWLAYRRPHGSDSETALEAAKTVERVRRELAGEHDCLTLDTALAASRALHLEERLSLWAYLLERVGLAVAPAEIESIGNDEPRNEERPR